MANFFLALGVVAFFVAIGLCLYGVLILGHEVIKLQGMVEALQGQVKDVNDAVTDYEIYDDRLSLLEEAVQIMEGAI